MAKWLRIPFTEETNRAAFEYIKQFPAFKQDYYYHGFLSELGVVAALKNKYAIHNVAQRRYSEADVTGFIGGSPLIISIKSIVNKAGTRLLVDPAQFNLKHHAEFYVCTRVRPGSKLVDILGYINHEKFGRVFEKFVVRGKNLMALPITSEHLSDFREVVDLLDERPKND